MPTRLDDKPSANMCRLLLYYHHRRRRRLMVITVSFSSHSTGASSASVSFIDSKLALALSSAGITNGTDFHKISGVS
jgi:hypothetical protein